MRCRVSTILELTTDHAVGKGAGLELSPVSTRMFCPLDAVRHLDHQIGIRQPRMLGADVRHGIFGRLLDLLLVAVFYVVVERTFVATILGIAEMAVFQHVLGADVARRSG